MQQKPSLLSHKKTRPPQKCGDAQNIQKNNSNFYKSKIILQSDFRKQLQS